MAAFLIGQPDPNFKPRHQQVRRARAHPSGPRLNQLAQGGIKPEPQLDHLQDTPLARFCLRAARGVAAQISARAGGYHPRTQQREADHTIPK